MGKEDHVSMGATGAYRTFKASKLLSKVISSELICSTQALENIPEKASDSVMLIYSWIRKYVSKLVEDRSTSSDTNIISDKILTSEFTDIFRK
jgi:histidine ammonia-lyase